ncbi:MAG: tetratricopeptide repeat protein, partial [Bradymonadaceae bacterium]
VYYNLGNIYQKRGMYDQAIKAYRTSLSYRDDIDVDTLVNIGGALTILGKRDAARTAYERARKKAPRDPRVPHGLAILLHLDGEYQAALDTYGQLHSMAPDYARAYYDKARPLLELDRTRDAIGALEQYLELAPDGDYAQKARERIKTYEEQLENRDPQ